MLRLTPSELTLTPDDVEKTFRRIALRQTSRPQQHVTMHSLGQPGRPILRRGSQRPTRDAITALGNIPIIQPQQAVFTPVDEDGGHASGHAAAQPTFHHGSPAVSPVTHTTQLPFRPGADSLGLASQSTAHVQAVPTWNTRPSRPSAFVTPASARGIDSAIPSTWSPSADSATSTSVLRGGGRTRSGHHAPPPSPLYQMQRLNSPAQQASPGDPTKSPTSPSPGRPTLYLKGYVAQTPHGPRYRFHERLPHSEPRYRSGRQAPVKRSLSSSAAPSSHVASQNQHHPDHPFDDVFGTEPATEPIARRRRASFNSANRDDHASAASDSFPTSVGSRQLHQLSPSSRQFSSDATGASSAYSWYGSLPSDTHFPSSARSSQHEASHQIDGSGLRGPCPLPSMPYTRIQNDSESSPAAPSYLDPVSEGFVDAATAVVHDVQSPLDAYAEHYQRELQAQNIRSAVYAHANPSLSGLGGSQARRSSRSQNTGSSDIAHFAPGPRTMVSRQAQQRSSEHVARSATYRSNISTRSRQATDMFTFRHSMPQTTTPYDRSNRRHDYTSHHGNAMRLNSPSPMHQPRHASQSYTHYRTHGGSPILPRLPPHQGSRQHASTLWYRPAPGALRLQPTRDSPLTALALEQGSGTTSRRPHSPLLGITMAATARTHRRILPEQRDQENDGDRGLMRREEASIQARYGEDEQQRSTMNETPPRIGRIERRMME